MIAMPETLSMNQTFIKKLTEIVLADLSVENFGAEELAKEAGMSRVNLYRKLRTAKHEDISHFIREVRLKRAMEMLLNQEGTASEIAFRVGFSSPAYFNKCFHDQYGYPPGEVKKREPVSLVNVPAVEKAAFSGSSQKSGLIKSLMPWKRPPVYRNIMLISGGILTGLLLILIVYFSILKVPSSPVADSLKDPIKSIIVLPFKSISDNDRNKPFADGMTEEVLNCFYEISELRVFTNITAEQLRSRKLTASEIARELGVNYILDGSVQINENKVRIMVRLGDALKDRTLWANRYDKDRDLTNTFSIQSDIALEIKNAMDSILSSGESSHIEKIPAKNPEAQD
jgi:TolB-like protein/AraC-like DNA-binding protein